MRTLFAQKLLGEGSAPGARVELRQVHCFGSLSGGRDEAVP